MAAYQRHRYYGSPISVKERCHSFGERNEVWTADKEYMFEESELNPEFVKRLLAEMAAVDAGNFRAMSADDFIKELEAEIAEAEKNEKANKE